MQQTGMGVADSEEAMQRMADTLRAHLLKWRLKANIPKKNVAAPAVPTIKWGEECLPIADSYKYLGAGHAAQQFDMGRAH